MFLKNYFLIKRGGGRKTSSLENWEKLDVNGIAIMIMIMKQV